MAAPPESAPTTAAIASATAIISLAVGFFIGQGYSVGVFGQARVSQPRHAVGKQPPHEDSDSDLTDDSTSENGHERLELATFPDNDNEECKLVLVTRTDLGMVSFRFPVLPESIVVAVRYMLTSARSLSGQR